MFAAIPFTKQKTGVRSWRRVDLGAIREVAWTTWMDAYAAFIPVEDMRSFHEEYYSLPRLRQLYSSGLIEGWVAVDGAKIVGYSKSHWNETKGEFYVTSLYVLPDHQKLGLGKALLASAIQRALELKTDRIWLGVMEQNKPAMEWYIKQGFRFIEKKPFTIGATTVDDLIGYKKIGSAPTG